MLTLRKSLSMHELIPFTQCRFSEMRKLWSRQQRCCLTILKPVPPKQQFPAWCCCLRKGSLPHSWDAGCVPIHVNFLPKICVLLCLTSVQIITAWILQISQCISVYPLSYLLLSIFSSLLFLRVFLTFFSHPVGEDDALGLQGKE